MPKEKIEIARRCSLCAIDWPDTKEYKKCPQCEEATDRCRDVTPLPDDEAKALRLNYEFERFYEKWDNEKPASRLKPGAAEAKYR